MGVLYDYFRAASDASAIKLMEDLGGGPVVTATGSPVDAIDLKGIEPAVTLGKLVGLVRGVPWDVNLVQSRLLWSLDEQGPWLMSIADGARDTLASIEAERFAELSAQWGRIEELSWHDPLPDDRMLPVIEKISTLAARAANAGEHLYCWCSL
jgi:hypothetical protein